MFRERVPQTFSIHRCGLTGIANRRMFDTVLEREWSNAQRTGSPLSLIILDIDYFKQYNDHYGHINGDECLRRMAQTLSLATNCSIRPNAMAGCAPSSLIFAIDKKRANF